MVAFGLIKVNFIFTQLPFDFGDTKLQRIQFQVAIQD
jgi:hypothetical protein